MRSGQGDNDSPSAATGLERRGMDEQGDDVSEDQLLELPEQALPGDLSRLWSMRANILHQREADELNAELTGDAPPRMIFAWTSPYEKRRIEEKRRREQREYEQAMLEISERRDRLLQQIEQEQARIDERRKEIEDHALRLHDGRRVYVDGERYRDGEGRLLTGADESEAARQHEYRPDASTWAEKQDIDRRADENQRLKREILRDKESAQGAPQEEARKLDTYEKEFAEKVQARTEQPVTDYGSADYMSEYRLSAVPAFTAAANPKPAVDSVPKEEDTGTATAEAKKPLPPFTQAPPKFQV
jgi:hypothetical protein